MNRRSPNGSAPQRTATHAEPAAAPQKLRDRLREATNEAILQSAEKVFAAHGRHAARMESIAAGAGVAVGTLYNHFKDRDALFGELVLARRAEMLARLDTALAEGERAPFAAQVRLFVDAMVQHFNAHQAFLAILMDAETSTHTGAPRAAMQQVYERASELVRRGVSQRLIRKDDAEIFPTLLMGMLKGCMIRQLYYEAGNEDLARRSDQVVRFFLEGAGGGRHV